jgi:hypothetical protein
MASRELLMGWVNKQFLPQRRSGATLLLNCLGFPWRRGAVAGEILLLVASDSSKMWRTP